jgi:hypothetical protein
MDALPWGFYLLRKASPVEAGPRMIAYGSKPDGALAYVRA